MNTHTSFTHDLLRRALAVLLALPLLVVLAGCSGGTETEAEPAAAPPEDVAQADSESEPEPTAEDTATPEPTATATAEPTATATATPTPEPQQARFAVIGDFGLAGPEEEEVADLVKSWEPDFVVTTGDNNYPHGTAETMDENVGQYYHEFIGNYQGEYGPGAETNRFFPVIGNHDVDTAEGQAYFDYFTLPGNERYYTVEWPPVKLFAVNSVAWIEPDGADADSAQAEWLQQELAASPDSWNVVVFHHPPYGSGYHGASEWMRWPFQEWGGDVALSGHNHVYERNMIDGFPYITNGLGGGARYAFSLSAEGSEVRFNADHGAMLVEADEEQMTLQFVTTTGEVVDTYTLSRE